MGLFGPDKSNPEEMYVHHAGLEKHYQREAQHYRDRAEKLRGGMNWMNPFNESRVSSHERYADELEARAKIHGQKAREYERDAKGRFASFSGTAVTPAPLSRRARYQVRRAVAMSLDGVVTQEDAVALMGPLASRKLRYVASQAGR
jgi:hypothetical protein